MLIKAMLVAIQPHPPAPRSCHLRRLFPILYLFSAIATALPAWAAKIATSVFDTQKDDLHQQITMTVEYWSNSTVVNYYNEFGEHEITVFDGTLQPRKVTYINPRGQMTSTVNYDYRRNCLVLSGLNSAKYRLSENTFDNNGSLFYVFSLLYPTSSEPLVFHMVQSNLAHIESPLLRLLICQLVGPVEMYLKNKGTENVDVLGVSYRAVKYELGIHDPRLVNFWPHVYTFWYQVGDRKPIKYEGLDADRNVNTIILVDYYERDLPEACQTPTEK